MPAYRHAYETDLTDEQWQIICSLVEVPQQGPGPRRSVNLREVVNALLYKQRTRCQWRMLPHDLPPRSTVSGYYQRWKESGVWDQVLHLLSTHEATPAMPAHARAERLRQPVARHDAMVAQG